MSSNEDSISRTITPMQRRHLDALPILLDFIKHVSHQHEHKELRSMAFRTLNNWDYARNGYGKRI